MPGMRQTGYSMPAGFLPGGASRTGLSLHSHGAVLPCDKDVRQRRATAPYCGYINQMRYYTYAFSVHK